MSNVDTATAFAAALSAHDLDKLASLITDDFSATGLAPVPMSKQMFLDGQRAWYAGCPDWTVTPGALSEQGDVVTGQVMITATQTGALSLPGAPSLPPSGKRISSNDAATLTVRGGQVAKLDVVSGSPSLIEQLQP